MAPPAFRGRWSPTVDQTSLSLKKRAKGVSVQFGFTAAQSNCTWDELAAIWDTADDIDLYRTGWTYDHFYPLRTGPEEPTLEGWTALAMLLARTRRLRGGVLVSGVPVPAPGRAGQHGRDDRHRVRRTPGAGDRRRVVRGRVRGLRHRAGLDHRALRPVRGVPRGHPLAAHRADDHLLRPLLRAHRRVLRAQGHAVPPPAVRARRQGRAPVPPPRRPLRRPLELLR